MHRVRVAVALVALLTVSACASATQSPATGHHLSVVAAENFWGSLAIQLGGDRVSVTSVVTDPNADPHEYGSSSDDARAFATADLVILNGAGYDSWAQRLVDANPADGRTVTTIATVVGKSAGDNPHFWYDPGFVTKAADQITADLSRLDASDAAYFATQRATFEGALKPYRDRIAAIRATFAGRKVASTETVFVYMATALGLNLISPPEFMKAVAEGNDPSVEAVAQFQSQLQNREAVVFIYNTQTVTPITTNLKQLAAQQGIPSVGVTETMQPSDGVFQDWQTAQLSALQSALSGAPVR